MIRNRILIVDDAVVVRRLLSRELAADPALEVVGTAPNGRIALAKIPQLNPDLVILDVDMPEMDGLQTLAALRRSYPRLPVIMFSVLTRRGAAATLEALTLGASDYVTKPANGDTATAGVQSIHDELIPKIKLFCARAATPTEARPREAPAVPARSRPRAAPAPVEVVALGVSTGGPNALARLIPTLPADFPVPLVIVQHMPPVFTQLLAGRLAAHSALAVREGLAGEALLPGQAWLAPGDRHMALAREAAAVRLRLHQGPPENSCRPAVDVLFRSAAEVYGAGVLAVVLTGMGQDGLRGCERVHAAGGQILVQDEASSVIWGMPGYVARAGLADRVLPLDELGPEIVRRVRSR